MNLKGWLEENRKAMKDGYKKGQIIQIEHPRAIWIPLLIIAVIFLFVFSYSPADAYPTKDELLQQARFEVRYIYGYSPPSYIVPSLPVSFTKQTVQYIPAGINDCFNRYYRLSVYGNSITPEILHGSINKVNPFFHIAVVGIDDSMYSFDSNGEVYCKKPYTIIITHTNGAYRGVSKGRGCVTIYVPYSFSPRMDGLSRLIEHELCHEIQTEGNIDLGYPLDKCISDYSRECSNWKTQINIIRT